MISPLIEPAAAAAADAAAAIYFYYFISSLRFFASRRYAIATLDVASHHAALIRRLFYLRRYITPYVTLRR